jgi:hypothetical protein
MLARTGRILLLAAAMVLSTSARPAVCLAWSLWPFGSESKTEAKPKRPPPRAAKKPPSTWNKVTTGTKNFCGKVGNALTFNKSPPKKPPAPQYAVPRMPAMTPKKEESKSWLGSWLTPAEPKKPRTVGEWMDTNKRMDP